MSNVVDLGKFASNNEINKWICQILGLPDDARRTFEHSDLVQLLGRAVIEQRILVESVRNAVEKVAHGLIDIGGQTVPEFCMDLVTVIDNFQIPAEVFGGGEGA